MTIAKGHGSATKILKDPTTTPNIHVPSVVLLKMHRMKSKTANQQSIFWVAKKQCQSLVHDQPRKLAWSGKNPHKLAWIQNMKVFKYSKMSKPKTMMQ